MAALASVTTKQLTSLIGLEIVKGTVTTTGDKYTSRFSNIVSVQISDRTTAGVAKVSVSGSEITITCTSGDVVDLWIAGY